MGIDVDISGDIAGIDVGMCHRSHRVRLPESTRAVININILWSTLLARRFCRFRNWSRLSSQWGWTAFPAFCSSSFCSACHSFAVTGQPLSKCCSMDHSFAEIFLPHLGHGVRESSVYTFYSSKLKLLMEVSNGLLSLLLLREFMIYSS